jgi:hypothetical protein
MRLLPWAVLSSAFVEQTQRLGVSLHGWQRVDGASDTEGEASARLNTMS